MDKPKQPAQNISKGTTIMINLWQYWLWSFQGRDTKLERFLAIGTQRKSLNFENWSSGEVSKIGHH